MQVYKEFSFKQCLIPDTMPAFSVTVLLRNVDYGMLFP